ncbi:TetR/AcrR family transcriptional regulator [Variovorax davisae]|uniref:TetR/AcrR family transcriptional regulator n=1 Tax=Variovorax davisae TaxID=3053515 RepID=UPI0025769A89|nr:TetR/AcrR family transcriptional regulator [Variovorax sp. J22P271]
MERLEEVLEPKRRSRARGALTQATKRLLSKGSAMGFTIDDVVREADVARGTFYNHFNSLEELIDTTKAAVQADLQEKILEAALGSPDAPTTIARGVATTILYGYRDVSNARVLIDVRPGFADPGSPRNAMLVRSLNEGISAGQFKVPSLDAAVAAVLGICDVGTTRMMEIHHEYSAVRELANGLCVLVLRSLGADARRVERIAKEAVDECFDKPLGRQK